MKFRTKTKLILLIFFIFNTFSCTTMRANLYLFKTTTAEEKSKLLFNEGERLYKEEFKENSNLQIIPKINQYFSDAYKLDPTNEEAQAYILDLENFKTDLFKNSMDTIMEISELPDRSEEEDYKLVLSIKLANELKIKDKILKDKSKEFKYLIPIVVLRIESKLIATEKELLNEAEINSLIALIIKYRKILNEIIDFDSQNDIGKSSYISVSSYINSVVSKNIDESNNLMNERNYVASELLIRKSDQLYSILFKEKSKEILSFKYSLFMNWGEYLYKKGQYSIAKDITQLAYNLTKSRESLELIRSIEKSISTSSFESTINDILATIDYYIEKEDPSNAQKIINTNLTKFKNPKNRESLTNKKDVIDKEVEKIYNQGIKQYQDEDYEGALERFKIVYSYNSNYKQIKDYYDRTDRKVKALSGVY